MKNSTHVKRALQYVLLNPAKHFKRSPYIDRYTSAAILKNWSKLLGCDLLDIGARSQLLRQKLKDFLPPPQLWLVQQYL